MKNNIAHTHVPITQIKYQTNSQSPLCISLSFCSPAVITILHLVFNSLFKKYCLHIYVIDKQHSALFSSLKKTI